MPYSLFINGNLLMYMQHNDIIYYAQNSFWLAEIWFVPMCKIYFVLVASKEQCKLNQYNDDKSI